MRILNGEINKKKVKVMKIIKRSGQETSFDEEKIVNAVKKANKEVNEVSRISDEQIRTLAHGVAGGMRAHGPRGQRRGNTGYGRRSSYGDQSFRPWHANT